MGLVNNTAAYLIFILSYALTSLKVLSATVSFIVAVVSSYILHSKYSFRSDFRNAGTFMRYLIVYLWGYASSIMLLLLLSRHLFSAEISQLIAMVLIAIELYILNKFFVFSA